jgi:prevent-host-death family protein
MVRPMKVVNIHAAKTHLSRLVEEAANGEDIVIAKAGKHIARLAPLQEKKAGKRRLGLLAGKLKIPADFDAPLPEDVMDAFEGR